MEIPRRLMRIGLIVVAVVAGVVIGTRYTAFAQGDFARPDGTFLVEFRIPSNDPAAPNGAFTARMLASFFVSGQVLATDETQFGFAPRLCPGDPSAPTDASNPGELRGPAQGSWRVAPPLHMEWVLLSTRFDRATGRPIGFLRARGRGRPTSLQTAAGSALIEFFDADVNPLTGTPSCSLPATWQGTRVPAHIATAQVP